MLWIFYIRSMSRVLHYPPDRTRAAAEISGRTDKDETALAVFARVAGVAHRLKRGDFVN